MSSADPRRAAVLGSPVGHSLSPVLHRAAYAALGLTGWTYDAIDIGADGALLPDIVRRSGTGWAGFSVTMPGKPGAAAIADDRSTRVRRLGVANTLVRHDGGWAAENTDVDGVAGALTAAGATGLRRGLIIGAGGTGMAALLALSELGVTDLVVAGRRESSTAAALELAHALGLGARHAALDPDGIAAVAAEVDVAVATAPAGALDALAAPLAGVPVLFDAIYHPWPTALAAAGAAGRITVTGLDMLLHQAFRQVELMTGRAAPRAAMRDALIAAAGATLPLPY
ncbi:shikimate dehydrogenase [Nakamurella deserti]|uniref:shikimate dehydrogenase n=1 Tax=Nakamurella deserti TaxID=2164074 RepID=UPI000DBE72CE|nr:shikimate dehydrogenase [Nakamurella deserti]